MSGIWKHTRYRSLSDQVRKRGRGAGGASASCTALGAAEAICAIADTMGPSERREYNRMVAAAQAELGEEAFAAVWAEGRALAVEQAIAEALDECSRPSPNWRRADAGNRYFSRHQPKR